MRVILVFICFICGAASLLWLLVAAIKPNLLFGVLPEKRTRKNAVCFPALLAATCVTFAVALAPNGPWWTWGIALSAALLTGRYFRRMTMTEEQLAVEKEKNRKLPEENRRNKEEKKLRNIEVFSTNPDSDKTYTLDVIACTCTCPDWEKRRSGAPDNSPFLLCKHLTDYFCSTPDAPKHEWLKPFDLLITCIGVDKRGMPYWHPECSEWGEKDGEGYILSMSREEYPWMNVHWHGTRRGFNLETGRWARNNKPSEHYWLEEKAYALTGQSHPRKEE